MRVFTQRFHPNIELLPWEKPTLGQFPEFDAWVNEFNNLYPNIMRMDMHELDYKVWFDTPDGDTFFITGYYWGDESTLEAAYHWVGHNQVLDVPLRRWVITCPDDQHPAEGAPANLQIDSFLEVIKAVKRGHWLWSSTDSIFTPYQP